MSITIWLLVVGNATIVGVDWLQTHAERWSANKDRDL